MVLHSGEPVGGGRVIHAMRHDYSPDSDTIHLDALGMRPDAWSLRLQ